MAVASLASWVSKSVVGSAGEEAMMDEADVDSSANSGSAKRIWKGGEGGVGGTVHLELFC
eukprot:scaffold34947_cov101-Isochrysis_galbana.AAC.3